MEGSLGDNIDIVGNLDLISESGNNWELGLVQEVKGEGVSLLLEAAAFVLNYDEMIVTLLPQVDSNNAILFTPEGDPMFFFKPLNLGRTLVQALSLAPLAMRELQVCHFELSRATRTTAFAGYLTNDPAQDSLGVFVSNFFDSFGDTRAAW